MSKKKTNKEVKPKVATKFYLLKVDYVTSKGTKKAGTKIELDINGFNHLKKQNII